MFFFFSGPLPVCLAFVGRLRIPVIIEFVTQKFLKLLRKHFSLGLVELSTCQSQAFEEVDSGLHLSFHDVCRNRKKKKTTLDKAKKFGVFVYQSECISVQCNFLLQWNSRNKGGNDNNTSLCSCPSAACFFITFRQTLMPVKGKVFTQANKMQKKRSVFWHTNPVYSLCCLSSDSMSVWVQCQCQPDREWERGRDRQRPRNLALQHLHTLLTLHKRKGTVP